MANLILPSRFTQQPQYPVEVNYSGIGSGVGIAILPSTGFRNLVNGEATPVVGSGVTVKPCGHGLAFSDFGSGYVSVPVPSIVSAVPQRSAMLLLQNTTTSNQGAWKLSGLGNDCHWPYADVLYANDFADSRYVNGAAVPGGVSSLLLPHKYFVTRAAGNNDVQRSQTSYKNNQVITTASVFSNHTTPYRLGQSQSGMAYTGFIAGFVVWNRELSYAEVVELNSNPWQIFRKRPQILYFDVGGGGATTYTYSGSGSVTFSGSAALDKVKSYPGSGSITYSGTATTAFVAGAQTYAYNGSGSINFAGTATTTTSKIYGFAGSGSLTFSGAATTTLVPVGSTTYSYNGSGSIAFSGTATTAEVKLYSATGSGSITFDGTATTAYVPGLVVYSYTGSGSILFSGAAETTGPKVVELRPAGGGTSTVSGRKRQKLIIVERVEDVEELLEQVEEIVKAEPKARKLKLAPKKPKQTVQNQPEAAFDWLSYYQAKLDTLRDQQRAESLKRQLDKNAEIIRAILAKQEEEARLALELQQEEEMMLLLMAA